MSTHNICFRGEMWTPLLSVAMVLFIVNNQNYFNLGQVLKQVLTNCVGPDQMPQNVASDLDLHYSSLIVQFLDTFVGGQMDRQILGHHT